MRILVDADACSVVNIIEQIAHSKDVPVILFCDTSRIITSNYSEVKVVCKGQDATDFAILRECKAGDIVVTHDYELASLAMSMKCKVIHPKGRIYTSKNLDILLADRHLARRYRRSSNKNKYKRYYPVHNNQIQEPCNFKENLSKLIDESLLNT